MRRKRKFIDLPDAVKPVEEAPAPSQETTGVNYSDVAASKEFQTKAGVDAEKKDDSSVKIAEVVITFKPEDFAFVLDVYAAIISFIFASALKSDFVTVHNVCQFDKEQKKALSEALCPVVAKYFPEDWIKYLPEIRLAMMLAAITGGKFQQAQEAVKAKTIDAEKTKTV